MNPHQISCVEVPSGGSPTFVSGEPLDLVVDPHGKAIVVFEVGPQTSVTVLPVGALPPAHMRRYVRAAAGPYGVVALWST